MGKDRSALYGPHRGVFMLTRKRVDSNLERKLVAALAQSEEMLKRTAHVIDPKLLKSEPIQMIVKWILDYFLQYGKAPDKTLFTLHTAWAEQETTSEEQAETVGTLLRGIFAEFGTNDHNVPYLIDSLGKHLTTRKLAALRDEIDLCLLRDDLTMAEELVHKFSTVQVLQGEGVDFILQDSAWDEVFSESQESLIKFPGLDAESFFGNSLCRDNLLGILAPEKRGKTWFCLELAFRALECHRKVAIFEVGDMSQSQILMRVAVRLTGKPQYESQCGQIPVPTEITLSDEGDFTITTKTKTCMTTVDASDISKARKRFLRANALHPENPSVMLSCSPNSTQTVAGIDAILERWQIEQNFVPDVILIDYPDILAPEPGTKGQNTRDQINTTWKALRKLSQERHCLVVAPTQANAASYKANTLSMGNFSEDKRKFAHVTGMLGLNQEAEEKEKGIVRLNWIVLREAEFHSKACLAVAQCLSLGKAFCASVLDLR